MIVGATLSPAYWVTENLGLVLIIDVGFSPMFVPDPKIHFAGSARLGLRIPF